MKDVCEVCGNDRIPAVANCRFCGERHTKKVTPEPDGPLHKVVNLEYGRPVVEDAIKKLGREIDQAHLEGIAILTIIHGYGSSGKGGAIRQECRKTLDYMESRGKIKQFITGERFAKKHGETRSLLRRFPQFVSNGNLNRGNRGVTLVVVR